MTGKHVSVFRDSVVLATAITVAISGPAAFGAWLVRAPESRCPSPASAQSFTSAKEPEPVGEPAKEPTPAPTPPPTELEEIRPEDSVSAVAEAQAQRASQVHFKSSLKGVGLLKEGKGLLQEGLQGRRPSEGGP